MSKIFYILFWFIIGCSSGVEDDPYKSTNLMQAWSDYYNKDYFDLCELNRALDLSYPYTSDSFPLMQLTVGFNLLTRFGITTREQDFMKGKELVIRGLRNDPHLVDRWSAMSLGDACFEGLKDNQQISKRDINYCLSSFNWGLYKKQLMSELNPSGKNSSSDLSNKTFNSQWPQQSLDSIKVCTNTATLPR